MAVIKARNSQGQWEVIGVRGNKGPTGDDGPIGQTGTKGATGTPGAAGDKGPQGPQGFTGPNHYFQLRYGTASVTPVANTPTASAKVYYSAPFKAGVIPTVVISMRSSVPGTTVINVSVNSPENDGFVFYIMRTNTTATNVDWIAVGER